MKNSCLKLIADQNLQKDLPKTKVEMKKFFMFRSLRDAISGCKKFSPADPVVQQTYEIRDMNLHFKVFIEFFSYCGFPLLPPSSSSFSYYYSFEVRQDHFFF